VALHAKKGSGAEGSRDMGKVKYFACHKTGHYANQCPKKKEAKVATTSSTEMDAFAEKFEDEFSLVASLSSNNVAELEDSGVWFVDSGSSHHMMGVRLVFLSVSKTGLDSHVGSGADTMHAVKGVGCVRFQLESGGSLEVAEVLYVPEMKVNLLFVAALEDMQDTRYNKYAEQK
jgi:hypothetical protein